MSRKKLLPRPEWRLPLQHPLACRSLKLDGIVIISREAHEKPERAKLLPRTENYSGLDLEKKPFTTGMSRHNMPSMVSLRKSAIVPIVCMLNLWAVAQYQLIEIEELQLSKSTAGVVIDPSGAAIPNVTVEERSNDWKIVLRTTHTDEKGSFHFSRNPKRVVHLEFSSPGFNRLRIRVQLDKKGEAKLAVKMSIAT